LYIPRIKLQKLIFKERRLYNEAKQVIFELSALQWRETLLKGSTSCHYTKPA